jgi:hypothetical protein
MALMMTSLELGKEHRPEGLDLDVGYRSGSRSPVASSTIPLAGTRSTTVSATSSKSS